MLAQVHDDLFQPFLEHLVLAAHVEIIQELLLAFNVLVLLICHEDQGCSLLLVGIELFPEHVRVFHCQRLDCQPQLLVHLKNTFLREGDRRRLGWILDKG